MSRNVRPRRLSKSITAAEFDRGYWYATELKRFASSIGVPSPSKLRKDELELAVRGYLVTGQIDLRGRPSRQHSARRDSDRGLRLGLRVAGYTNDAETKSFLEREAKKLSPGYRRRSGARYRLNRWREAQTAAGIAITYRDLVAEYVRLSHASVRFAQAPTGRYINFLSDFFANERGAARQDGLAAWRELKRLDIPKNYQSWAAAHALTQR